MSLSESEGTINIDIDLLAAGNLNIQGSEASSDNGLSSCIWTYQTGLYGAVGCRRAAKEEAFASCVDR